MSKKTNARSEPVRIGTEAESLCLIYRKLALRKPVSVKVLAKEGQVSDRQVKRVLERLKDRYRLTITYDRARGGHVLEGPGTQELEEPALLESQRRALAITLRLLGATSLGVPLAGALRKLGLNVEALVAARSADTAADAVRWEFSLPGLLEGEVEVFARLNEAREQSREVTMEYRKPEARAVWELRRVQPLAVLNRRGRWGLVAWCCDRRRTRTFLLTRVREVRITDKVFVRRTDFDPSRYFEGSIGFYVGTGDHEVRALVHESAVGFLQENPWHESQVLAEEAGPGGWHAGAWRVNNLVEIQREILAWGRAVRVLAPAELAERIRAEAQALVAEVPSAPLAPVEAGSLSGSDVPRASGKAH